MSAVWFTSDATCRGMQCYAMLFLAHPKLCRSNSHRTERLDCGVSGRTISAALAVQDAGLTGLTEWPQAQYRGNGWHATCELTDGLDLTRRVFKTLSVFTVNGRHVP
jgi:hypothetical protein